MPESFDYGRNEQNSFNYGRDEKDSFDYGLSEKKENLPLEDAIARRFIKVNERVINHHNDIIDITKKAMSGLEATDIQSQSFQIRIDNLLEENEKLIAENKELKENPTEETINRIKTERGII